ncbi:Phosphoglycerate transport regulatory protein PgtC [Pandoraea iniqua]|uniref:ABC transporter substrate-binding protein n=1 Tax=Pandoraea iniqua TaxID=2508288 RepID=UPI0012542A18|nr:extracellular solute-binding protein [Pandoraea iniqua]VVE11320.1 Phosphoglycerate transport regulatory protein PgtC [Pandoraea iniqua]
MQAVAGKTIRTLALAAFAAITAFSTLSTTTGVVATAHAADAPPTVAPPKAASATQRETLTVLTSYPEEVVATFERAFEKQHPEIALQILWRQHRDAYDYLQGPKQGGVDVYWSPAVRNFADLGQEGSLRKLDVDLTGLPSHVGKFRISDPDGRFVASEIAGFGFMLDPAALARQGLPAPKTWQDLTLPRYRGHIMFPVPSRVGFAPTLLDVVLQAEGWDKGWALLSEAGANFVFAETGGAFASLSHGMRAPISVAVTIDFFASSAIANGAPLTFVYPPGTGYSPAHIGILRDTPHLGAARTFVSFVLSDAGQRLLFAPDVRKLPVRPSVYRDAPKGTYDPFAANAATAGVTYEETLGLARYSLDNALFDVFLTRRKAELTELWTRWHQLAGTEGNGTAKPVASVDAVCLEKARTLLTQPPIDANTAADPALRATFDRRRQDPAAQTKASALEATWSQTLNARTAQVREWLADGAVCSGK